MRLTLHLQIWQPCLKKREIILMLYFLDMTEKEIAACLKLVQSTVHYHKDDSLRLMRKLME